MRRPKAGILSDFHFFLKTTKQYSNSNQTEVFQTGIACLKSNQNMIQEETTDSRKIAIFTAIYRKMAIEFAGFNLCPTAAKPPHPAIRGDNRRYYRTNPATHNVAQYAR